MVPSQRKNLSAATAVVLLLVILTAGIPLFRSIILFAMSSLHYCYSFHSCMYVHVWIHLHAESSQGFWDGCNEHLSGSYKGACWPFINDAKCGTTCIRESFDNLSGTCHTFQCWCWTTC